MDCCDAVALVPVAARVEEVTMAIAETAPAVREHTDGYAEFREIGKRMLTEWERGTLDITPTITPKARAGEHLRVSVGLWHKAQ